MCLPSDQKLGKDDLSLHLSPLNMFLDFGANVEGKGNYSKTYMFKKKQKCLSHRECDCACRKPNLLHIYEEAPRRKN